MVPEDASPMSILILTPRQEVLCRSSGIYIYSSTCPASQTNNFIVLKDREKPKGVGRGKTALLLSASLLRLIGSKVSVLLHLLLLSLLLLLFLVLLALFFFFFVLLFLLLFFPLTLLFSFFFLLLFLFLSLSSRSSFSLTAPERIKLTAGPTTSGVSDPASSALAPAPLRQRNGNVGSWAISDKVSWQRQTHSSFAPAKAQKGARGDE